MVPGQDAWVSLQKLTWVLKYFSLFDCRCFRTRFRRLCDIMQMTSIVAIERHHITYATDDIIWSWNSHMSRLQKCVSGWKHESNKHIPNYFISYSIHWTLLKASWINIDLSSIGPEAVTWGLFNRKNLAYVSVKYFGNNIVNVTTASDKSQWVKWLLSCYCTWP